MAKKPVGMPVGKPVTSAEQVSIPQTSTSVIETIEPGMEIYCDPKIGISAGSNNEEPLPYTIATVSVQVPIVRGLSKTAYASRRVDITMSDEQAQVLRAITAGLRHHEAKLSDGRYVETAGHAVKWLLEQHLGIPNDIRRGDG